MENAPATAIPSRPTPGAHASKASLGMLTLGALGVVFGDIGTSPLYTLRQCIQSVSTGKPEEADVLGLLLVEVGIQLDL